MELFSTELIIAAQLLINLLIIIMILVFLRRLKASLQRDVSGEVAEQVVAMIEPLLNDADSAAKMFETQIREKHYLIKKLNERLDNRIISLNLLMDRAEACLEKGSDMRGSGLIHSSAEVTDQQSAIFDLYNDGEDSTGIAEKLSLSEREVDLIIDLKKRLVEMEKDGSGF